MTVVNRIEATVLGFPRIGPNRELKKVVEGFWNGSVSESDLLKATKDLRESSWKMQTELGLTTVPCNDFSLYDQILDAICLVGAIPLRYKELQSPGQNISLRAYFAMARGIQSRTGSVDVDQPAMEMKKFFDTNYHYLVPELDDGTTFKISTSKPFDEFQETKSLGIQARPVLIGPVSFLLLAKQSSSASKGFKTLSLLDKLIPVYSEILEKLVSQGATTIQFDEPYACMDPTESNTKDDITSAYCKAFNAMRAACSPSTKLMLTTYFQSPHPDLLQAIIQLPVDTIHFDTTRSSPQVFNDFVAAISELDGKPGISLGIVDGRNIWKIDATETLSKLSPYFTKLAKMNVMVSSSCSLLHSPWSVEGEARLDSEVLDWLAFAKEKIVEVVQVSRLLEAAISGTELESGTSEWFANNKSSNECRKNSLKTRNPSVRSAMDNIVPDMFKRQSQYFVRKDKQMQILKLPLFPTTTIGSFPQTGHVRKMRADYKRGVLSDAEYAEYIQKETRDCIKTQEEIGLDVLVHGEFERNDMVEFFGEHLNGMLFTRNGWVQSYGSRCVKPPIIYGDVSRTKPMTINMAKLAQSMSTKPVKGMLTGPVTILQWSFVRNDQPRKDSCQQLALAIREEVSDLQQANIKVVQVDEPAIREGLPMRKSEQEAYLQWSVDSFLLATAVAEDTTQIHSHMCYSDFAQIMPAIRRMDSDVLSIESSRSDLKLLSAFETTQYPNELGPGLFDIHSPRVPSVLEMIQRAQTILKYLSPVQFWINPDCGLKTRGWAETKAALQNLVEVAQTLRSEQVAIGSKDPKNDDPSSMDVVGSFQS